ncbi:MAG: spore coat protein [Clostridia bacterium]|jgi:spore coat protein CotF|nr:spore coat protein [Clostridia bacterium]
MNQQNQTWNQNQNANASQNQPLSDQELAFDLLYQEKSLLANIASEVLEASQPGMRQVLNDCSMQICQDQLEIFNQMQQQGWYPVKPAQPQDVQTAKQKYQQMRASL